MNEIFPPIVEWLIQATTSFTGAIVTFILSAIVLQVILTILAQKEGD